MSAIGVRVGRDAHTGACLLLACLAVMLSGATSAHAAFSSTPDAGIAGTNGSVYAIAASASRIYIGGSFSTVGGVARQNIAAIDRSTGALDDTFNPGADNAVRALAVAGSSVYAAGSFGTIGGQPRKRMAQLNGATGAPTAFDPNVNSGLSSGTVYAIAVSGATVYLGGFFSNAGGQNRNQIAQVDGTTGLATAFNPGADDVVFALATSGSTVYVGGLFNTIGGQPRSRIAQLDGTTGTPSAFNVGATTNERVLTLAVSGSTVYAGGKFTAIGGQNRNFVAALDATTGVAGAFDAHAFDDGYGQSAVTALAVSGSSVFVEGGFSTIGGSSHPRLAQLDGATGTATAFSPTVSGGIPADFAAVTADGAGRVYVGCNCTSIGGTTTSFVRFTDAAVAAPGSPGFSSTPDSGLPAVNGGVYAIAVGATRLYIGGSFTTVGGVPRQHIAAIDRATGAVDTAFNPGVGINGDTVNALAVAGSTLYVGGSFTTVAGLPRSNIAQLDATTGMPTAFAPDADGEVNVLAVSGATVYAGGNFATIGGRSRGFIAQLNGSTGAATSFNAVNTNNRVLALAVSGSTVYAGGEFGRIGGLVPRAFIAQLDGATGSAIAGFDARAGGPVYAVAVSGSTVYVGGLFTTFGPTATRVTRNHIAALSGTTGTPTAFNPSADGEVDSLAVAGSSLFAQGGFTTVGGQPRARIAQMNATGAVTAFNPGITGGNGSLQSALATDGTGRVYVGCDCTAVGGAATAASRRAGGSTTSSFARFSDGAIKTAVRWIGGKARVRRTGGVSVGWTTGRQGESLSFDVLRARRGHSRRIRVTPAPISSGALTGRRSSSSYAFTDRGGRRGDRYTILERDIDGHRTVHAIGAAR